VQEVYSVKIASDLLEINIRIPECDVDKLKKVRSADWENVIMWGGRGYRPAKYTIEFQSADNSNTMKISCINKNMDQTCIIFLAS
jgi:hypothetical protein